MKKFNWKLQRVLDVRMKQEDSLKNELAVINERAASIRNAIMLKRSSLKQQLEDVAEAPPGKRAAAQEFFLKFVHALDNEIDNLEKNRAEVQHEKQKKIQEILEVRKSRKGLEKLRESAKDEYMQEMERAEQRELDERNSIAEARKLLMPTV